MFIVVACLQTSVLGYIQIDIKGILASYRPRPIVNSFWKIIND